MPYTTHGHWHGPGEPTEPRPRLVARCGGPALCGQCSREAAAPGNDVRGGCAEQIARAFHEAYERLAPEHGYETRRESAVPWEDVPEQNKALMVAVVRSLLADGVISVAGSVVNVFAQGGVVSDHQLAETIRRNVGRSGPWTVH